MNILHWLKIYGIALPTFLVIDMIWLGYLAKGFYGRNMSPVVELAVTWWAAVLFYAVYVVGIVVFALRPAMDSNSLRTAVLFGALYGFFTYATYDLTNVATVKDWPRLLALVDIAWGTVLCTTVSLVTFLIARTFAASAPGP